eukprot:m.14306 g.14306  ORF g.14306 m.14306 type:complete len:140 (-) comp7582_c0_seq2:272-691(-)
MASKNAFLACERFIVVGASSNRSKFGNKVLRALVQKFGADRVLPVNPREEQVEGVKTYPNVQEALGHCNAETTGASIITPPAISLEAVKALVAGGVSNIWLQPGAEDEATIQFGDQHDLKNFLHSGPCLLVALGFSDHF